MQLRTMCRLFTQLALASALLTGIAGPVSAASSVDFRTAAKTGGSPVGGPLRAMGMRPLTARNTITAVCDADGPCLHTTSSAAGTPVNMFSFQSGDPFENLTLFLDSGDYGCISVTATCPFHNTHLDNRYMGDALVDLTFVGLAGTPCAEAYPGNDLHVESCFTAPDRRVFVLDNNSGVNSILIQPYWTNAGNCGSSICVLYGPPLNDTASVNTYTGNTRQEWHTDTG